jgi:hypothetical protein
MDSRDVRHRLKRKSSLTCCYIVVWEDFGINRGKEGAKHHNVTMYVAVLMRLSLSERIVKDTGDSEQ